MDFLLPVFQLAYFIVHFLYSLGQAVLDCFDELYHLICHALWFKKHFTPDSRQLLQDASKLKKIPNHLGLILTSPQTHSFKSVCHLLNWSLGFGIHTLSLYDVDGILKVKLPTLLDNISQICLNVTVKVIVDGQVYVRECNGSYCKPTCINSNSKDPNLVSSDDRNDILNQGKPLERRKYTNFEDLKNKNFLNLNVLCIEDGKEDIVKVAKTACAKNAKKKVVVDYDYFKTNLLTKDQIDPDLVVVIGRPICSLGFLPWQIRLTEFLTVPSISRLDYFGFRKLLRIYSKCEQRLGS